MSWRTTTQKIHRLLALPLMIMGLLLPALALAQPTIERPVSDPDDYLTPEQEQELASELIALRQTRGAHVAVVVLRTTSPAPIEDFTITMAQAWGAGGTLGRAALYLLAVEDRTQRLEVGVGLQEVIPDERAAQLLDGVKPQLARGEHALAIAQILGGMSDALAGKLAPLPHTEQSRAPSHRSILTWSLSMLALLMLITWFVKWLDQPPALEPPSKEPSPVLVAAKLSLLPWVIEAMGMGALAWVASLPSGLKFIIRGISLLFVLTTIYLLLKDRFWPDTYDVSSASSGSSTPSSYTPPSYETDYSSSYDAGYSSSAGHTDWSGGGSGGGFDGGGATSSW